MWENADQNNSEYEHLLPSIKPFEYHCLNFYSLYIVDKFGFCLAGNITAEINFSQSDTPAS